MVYAMCVAHTLACRRAGLPVGHSPAASVIIAQVLSRTLPASLRARTCRALCAHTLHIAVTGSKCAWQGGALERCRVGSDEEV